MSNPRNTVSRDRLAELRGGNNHRNSYSRLSDDTPPMPTVPAMPAPAYSNNSNNSNNNYYSRSTTYKNDKDYYELEARSTDQYESPEQFMAKVEEVKGLNQKISDNITRIENLRAAALSSITEDSRALEGLIDETKKLNNMCKEKIKDIERDNLRKATYPDIHMRKTQHATLKKKFMETIQRYQSVEQKYRQKNEVRVERQIRIAQPNATNEDIENILNSDAPPQIFAQSLMQTSRSGQAKAALSEVQSRHAEIKKLVQSISELNRLFLDMQEVVELQAETIKNIEVHTENAQYDVEQGNVHIDKAIVSARSTRKKKWMCFVIFIILLIVAGILIWWFAFHHAGVN